MLANLFINGVYTRDVEVEYSQDAFPCTWGDTDTAFMLRNGDWWMASPRTVVMNDRKGRPVVYWDRVHPDLLPPELRVYALIIN
jgi:hypothetical protein